MRNIIWSLVQLCRDAEGFMNLLVSAKLVYTQHYRLLSSLAVKTSERHNNRSNTTSSAAPKIYTT